MRRGITSALVVAWVVSACWASAPQDTSPWHLSKVTRLGRARPAEGPQPETEPLRYLHIEVRFLPALPDRKLHKFAVTDQEGKPVGELWGFNEDRSLLIFEREDAWNSLVGLYLEGLGHREPLFATQPVVVQPPPGPVVVVPPEGAQVVPVVPPAERIYVPGADQVIQQGPDRVVIQEGPDRVVVREGTDSVVYSEPGRVVHVEPGRTVYRGGDRVVVREGDTRVVHVPGATVGGAGTGGMGAGGGAGAAAGAGAAGGTGAGPGAGSASSPQGEGGAGAGGPAAPTQGEGPGSATGEGPCQQCPAEAGLASAAAEGQSPGQPAAAQPGAGEVAGQGQSPGEGQGAGQGQAPGHGQSPGEGQGAGQGQAPGEGQGAGQGEAPGQGMMPGQGQSPGEAPGQAPGQGPGSGQGQDEPPLPGMVPERGLGSPAAGPGSGPGGPVGPGYAGPGGGGPGGGGPGGGGGIGPGGIGPAYGVIGPDGPGVRVVDPTRPDLRFPDYPDRLVYRDIPWYLREFRPGYGYGLGDGGGGGYGGGAGGGDKPGYSGPRLPTDWPKLPPDFVLYISCGDEVGPGKVYQVNTHGRVLGIVNLPQTATGLALHRQHGLVCALPADGGKLMRIDDTGKVTTIMEKQAELLHPIDVGIAAESDSIVVADNIADTLMATSTAGGRPYLYHRFDGLKWEQQHMSVAVTTDRHVIFGTDGNEGIYRFSGDEYSASKPPLLPGRGGVAADTASLKWAATQSPNMVYVFEGEELMNTIKVPVNKSIFRQGLLSFGPANSVVVAVRDSQETEDEPWLIEYQTEEGKEGQIRSLFQWKLDRMVDFVVGPRMYWERHSPSTYESIY